MHLPMYSIAALLSAAISTAALPAFLGGGQGTTTSPAASFFGSSPALTDHDLTPPPISEVKFRQDAAVSARLILKWINPSDQSRGQKELGEWLSIDSEETFNLQKEGIHNGFIVSFASYVAAIGEYENNEWFTIEHSAHQRAVFRQTGTAFKGWFEFVGIENLRGDGLKTLDYDSLAVINLIYSNRNSMVASISHVKFRQDAAVSAYLIVKWLNPDDATPGSKELGPWKAINTEERFSLQDEGVPNGVLCHFASYVSAVGEYENDHWFKVDYSAGKGADMRQTGTAFKGWFEYTGLYNSFVGLHGYDGFKDAAFANVKALKDALAVIA
ncbi:hypothetical protein C8R46DRAFT_1262971 [Mycena filopes]|nr:hypothetical protein C8R46DRAFT_1262971 [Mycena filopes]